jgi:DNA-binding transcriptional LysR family regulator
VHRLGALFPGVLAETLLRQPDARFTLSERGFRHSEERDTALEFALAVLPTLAHPRPVGFRERVLWTEPIRVLVPADHELAASSTALTMDQLVRYPLVICGNSNTGGGALAMISAPGFDLQRRVGVDEPATLVDMVRRRIGVGVQNAVAIEQSDTSGLRVLDLDDPPVYLEVAAYWSDMLLATEIGRTLHGVLLEARLPPGALPARSRPDRPRSSKIG